MLRNRPNTVPTDLSPEIQSWWDGSQETTLGLDNPHAVIIDGYIRYSSTPSLTQEEIDGINERRRVLFGLEPLSMPSETGPDLIFRSPTTREVVGMMVNSALDGARDLFRR